MLTTGRTRLDIGFRFGHFEPRSDGPPFVLNHNILFGSAQKWRTNHHGEEHWQVDNFDGDQ